MSTSRGREPAGAPPLTSARRRARERALALLYEAEAKAVPPEAVLRELPVSAEPYAAVLVEGVSRRQREIDALIADKARGWPLERMAVIDRAVLRLGVYELLEQRDVPFAVVLDEAVELAKQYSTEDSGRFVNGILAALAADLRALEVHPT